MYYYLMEQLITIGQLAKEIGISSVAIRHYERIGLIKAKRSKAKYRLYSSASFEQLVFIKNAQTVGFSLKEIASILALIKNKKAASCEIKKRTLAKIEEIKAKMDALREVQTVLERLANACDGKVPLEKCPILQNLFTSFH
jgi:MerR family transcriptional regulator, copper efflux regulator